LGVKVTAGPARVEVRRSSQEITAHAGLVLVRELAARLGVGELLDRLTVKRRRRGFSPAQAVMAIVETLVAGGDCLDDSRLLRADRAQERLRGHALPEATTLGRFLRRFNIGHIAQLIGCSTYSSTGCTRWSGAAARSRSTSTRALSRRTVRRARARARAAPTPARSAGTRCSASSPRPASGWERSCARAARTSRPAPCRSSTAACAGCRGGARGAIRCSPRSKSGRSVKQRITEVPAAAWGPSCFRLGSEVADFRWRPKSWRRERRFVVRRDPVERGEQLSLEEREFHY
jgi:Transposase DDE domain group 1